MRGIVVDRGLTPQFGDFEGFMPTKEAAELFDYMQQLSNNHWDAGWLTDLGCRLWCEMVGESSWRFPFSAEEKARLKTLHEAAKGWIVWNYEKYKTYPDPEDPDYGIDPETIFISTDQFLKIYEAWRTGAGNKVTNSDERGF